ncbi:MAG: DbpA RNA binding domain-containing protein, partial [Spirochaetaceae bacterium]|nr:DbpA RNA binding domain-containing protein [Spirochaetaceae bacterium]
AGFTPHTLVFTDKLHRSMHPVKKVLARPKIIAKKDIIIVNGGGQANAGFSPESARDFLREAQRKIYAEDPGVLLLYRKLFTQTVPLLGRSTVAAWLLKYIVEKDDSLPRPSPASRRTPSRPDMRMLFFGLGKNRKVFPRDISGLILGKFPEMDKNDIGDIRILDSYSFVEVTENLASAVIEALNGTEYRGKTLAVNYARKKEN